MMKEIVSRLATFIFTLAFGTAFTLGIALSVESDFAAWNAAGAIMYGLVWLCVFAIALGTAFCTD